MNRKAETLLAATEGLGAGAFVVEVGTMRFDHEAPSDGASTLFLAERAKERGWKFVSIDNSEAAILNARTVLVGRGLDDAVELCLGDGEATLARMPGYIDFLYLDGAADPREALAQFMAARGKLAYRAGVAVDDVQEIAGAGPQGKGSLLLDRARELGWDVEVRETEPGYLMAVLT